MSFPEIPEKYLLRLAYTIAYGVFGLLVSLVFLALLVTIGFYKMLALILGIGTILAVLWAVEYIQEHT